MNSVDLNDGLEQFQTTSNYKFSAIPVDQVGASEITLVTLVTDVSGSVSPYAKRIEDMLKVVVKSCQSPKCPRADNLMFRLIEFSDYVTELHGFKPVESIKADDYTGIIKIKGQTALFDGTAQAVEATAKYGKELTEQDFTVNAIIFIITDGENNKPPFDASVVAKAVAESKQKEWLVSLTTVLIGVTDNNTGLSSYLQDFKDAAKLDQYVDIGSATPGKLAKLADFVSKSVSSTSQAITTGAPSQPLTF